MTAAQHDDLTADPTQDPIPERPFLISRLYWTLNAAAFTIAALHSSAIVPRDAGVYAAIYAVIPAELWATIFVLIAAGSTTIILIPTRYSYATWIPLFVSTVFAAIIGISILRCGAFLTVALTMRGDLSDVGWLAASNWILIAAATIARVREQLRM